MGFIFTRECWHPWCGHPWNVGMVFHWSWAPSIRWQGKTGARWLLPPQIISEKVTTSQHYLQWGDWNKYILLLCKYLSITEDAQKSLCKSWHFWHFSQWSHRINRGIWQTTLECTHFTHCAKSEETLWSINSRETLSNQMWEWAAAITVFFFFKSRSRIIFVAPFMTP